MKLMKHWLIEVLDSGDYQWHSIEVSAPSSLALLESLPKLADAPNGIKQLRVTNIHERTRGDEVKVSNDSDDRGDNFG